MHKGLHRAISNNELPVDDNLLSCNRATGRARESWCTHVNPVVPVRSEKLNVAILALSQTLFAIAMTTIMTLSGVVGLQLATDPARATLPVAMTMLGTVVSTLPASLFMRRVGRRVGFIAGVAIGGVAGGLLSFFAIARHSFWLFCASSLLLGLYQGFAMYYRFAAADAASPAFRNRAISLVMSGGVVAAFLGPLNASASLNLIPAVPSGGPYLVIALLAVAAIGLLTRLHMPSTHAPAVADESGDESTVHRPRPLRIIASRPDFIVAVTAGAIGYAVMILVMTATPLAMQARGFDINQVAFIMLWHVLGMFGPSFFTGGLIDRFGIDRILFAGVALLVGSSLVAAAGVTLVHFWIALVLLGVGWNFLFIGGSTLLATVHTAAERGQVQGVNDLIVFSFVTVGSLLAGAMLHRIGWEALNLAMLAPVAVVAVAVYVRHRNNRGDNLYSGIRNA